MTARPEEHSTRTRAVLAAAAVLGMLFALGPVAAPLLDSHHAALEGAARLAYSPLCHQLAQRSLSLGATPVAVCARCQGLYLGGAGALLLAAASRRTLRAPRPLLAVLWAATLLDVLLGALGLPSAPNWPRFVLALPTGFVTGLALAEGFIDLARMGRRDLPPIGVRPTTSR